mmetsp:Transcript_4821/g.5620  ORF Transcript_4821/g.5620 Transcript_4821/m.5620 type:complete len:974 (+) Transcript_4821:66-2987(+)|eukprot:CAMPEP_0197862920 /NCGR_PEP_ID=MMETSP1438-20131217/40022_1 /TAXON_ID=1461541 /ORGANISM="Pterosperma sp., Strain CCMP1384" /LENGTH=973 /DNA_ID=CAMNT_0043480641 /DNA_START=66 /DNA_END=2987 /DNA_ORIENTATION=+
MKLSLKFLLFAICVIALNLAFTEALGSTSPHGPGKPKVIRPSSNFADWKKKYGKNKNLFSRFNTTKVLKNEALQKAGLPIKNTVTSQIVGSADPVALMSGTGDVSTTNACKADIKRHCNEVIPGEGRVAECLSNIQKAKKQMPSARLSIGCLMDLRNFKIVRSQNINSNVRLAFACKVDAKKYCNETNLYAEPGAVITCLREVEEKLTSRCEKELFKTKQEASNDYETDAMLYELCEEDAKALCDGVKPEGGAVQTCLRSKRASLTWDCQEELFRKEVEDADDYRLNPTLLRLCSADKKKFCKDVKPGMGRAKQCLEANRKRPGFSAECKAKFEEMMARRASDFRLDSKLREECRDDIEEVCGYEKDSLDSVAGYDGRVIECLQDYKDELAVPSCQAAVHKLTERAAEDIRMDRPLADACFEDRMKLCPGVEPGSARVIRCLQEQRTNLTYECRATLFDQEVRFAEDIDFQYPLKKACIAEMELFCKKVPHGHGRIIKCLQAHDSSKQMSTECRTEVKRGEAREHEDYRLNYRVNKACDMEIDSLCPDVCSPFQGQACKGKVMSCLMENMRKITSQECKQELIPSIKTEVKDVSISPLLKLACKKDINTYCSGTTEKSQSIACLQNHEKELAKMCRVQVDKLTKLEMGNIKLNSQSDKCKEEMAVFCKGVDAGGARMYRCLNENKNKPDFGAPCKSTLTQRTNVLNKSWDLDFLMTKHCSADVNNLCAEAKSAGKESAEGQVLGCLANNYPAIQSKKCQKRFGAKFFNTMSNADGQKSPIGAPCREDVYEICNRLDAPIVCLAGTDKPITNAACAAMVDSVRNSKSEMNTFNKMLTANEQIKKVFSSMTNSAKEMDDIQSKKMAAFKEKFNVHVDEKHLRKTGNTRFLNKEGKSVKDLVDSSISDRQKGLKEELAKSRAARSEQGVTVTGWVALAGIGALVVCIVGGFVYLYRKFTGQDKVGQYTMVVKGGDI